MLTNIKMWDVPDKFPESEEWSERDYPERRLWCAVVINLLHEYESWLQRIMLLWQTENKPVPAALHNEIKDMRKHCTHRWFGVVCALADITQSMVIARLDRLDKDYCLASISFDETEQVIAYWRKRNLKRKPKSYQ